MAIDLDDEILQDFLVEAGEILDQLGEQLVDLEQSPDDNELLNAVFRGFHTIKGGASFVGLTALVELCHCAEDVFNILRNGERAVDAELMDAILPVTDILQDMFENVRAGVDPEPADPELVALIASFAQSNTDSAPATETAPAPAEQAQPESSETKEDDITDEEFEAILDAAQSGTAPPVEQQPETPAPASSDDITDDEFEALLDEMHGEGQFGGASEKTTGKAEAPPQKPAPSAVSQSDEISEDEFEALLDDLHGEGGSPTSAGSLTPAEKPKAKVSAKPAAKKADKKKETKKPEKAKEVTQAEATVRVDTKRLDDIMNMVGELVLVRNRLARLKTSDVEDDMSMAIGNLDVVTTDLQISVMKTRMQPVKKVFGRFPRVVRDLARSLKKEVNLELAGEDTELDKNLVEAIADPLVHLVRNAVDHGVEMPDEREKKVNHAKVLYCFLQSRKVIISC